MTSVEPEMFCSNRPPRTAAPTRLLDPWANSGSISSEDLAPPGVADAILSFTNLARKRERSPESLHARNKQEVLDGLG
jgi:hypothetical protein